MLINFSEYNSSTAIECDICIVGGGAAGISMAKRLAGSSLSVVILESGGLDLDFDNQLLANYSNVGDYIYEECRLRLLGGTTGHWGGASAPFSDFDMQPRDWVPYSGWPITRQEMDPYYRDAHALLELGDYDYGYPDANNTGWLPDYSNGLENRYYRKRNPATRFGTEFREELAAMQNVRVFYNAIVTNLNALTNAKAVDSVSIRDFAGKTSKVNAKQFVLAVGAMETPRILLLSNDIQPEGLGNGNDMVGRHYIQHPHANIGKVSYDSKAFVSQLTRQKRNNVLLVSVAGLSEDFQQQNKLLAGSLQLLPIPDPESGREAAKRIIADLKKGELPDEFGEELMRVLKDFDEVAAGMTGDNATVETSGMARMWVQSEQAPNPESRITLGDETDTLGLRKIVMDCRLQEIDHQTIKTLGRLYGSEVARLNMGRVQLDEWVISDDMQWSEDLESGCHHLGGARMSANPKQGVVDANCRVHDIDNLYIASSAVFPTGSDRNPTITIVALAMRLSDHLNQKLSA